jgi:hypothetical protein
MCSDGLPVCAIRWASNQLVDLMAKSAAESVRVSPSVREWLEARDAQLMELLVYIGKLTFEANHLIGPDGKPIRDAEAFPKRGPKKGCKKKSKPCEPVVINKGKSKATKVSDDWISAWSKSCERSRRLSQPACSNDGIDRISTRHPSAKSMQTSISVRQEASFQEWWRESRSHSLMPRDLNAPSGKDRLAALKARVVAKSATARCTRVRKYRECAFWLTFG